MIFLNGSWGTGKTSLLKTIERKLNEKIQKDSLSMKIVYFDAWKYEGTAPSAALAYCMLKPIESKKLGEMKLDKYGNDIIFLSNGFYRVNGIWKKRGVGFDHEKRIEIEHLDSQIDKNGEFFILLETTKTTHIKSGILYNKLHKVGKIEKYWKKINLNSDRKRVWIPAAFKSLNDDSFCDSVPIPADIVADLISKDDLEWYDYENEDEYEPESCL